MAAGKKRHGRDRVISSRTKSARKIRPVSRSKFWLREPLQGVRAVNGEDNGEGFRSGFEIQAHAEVTRTAGHLGLQVRAGIIRDADDRDIRAIEWAAFHGERVGGFAGERVEVQRRWPRRRRAVASNAKHAHFESMTCDGRVAFGELSG